MSHWLISPQTPVRNKVADSKRLRGKRGQLHAAQLMVLRSLLTQEELQLLFGIAREDLPAVRN